MKASRTEITIKTDRILVIRRSRRSLPVWCDECAEPSRMLTTEEAARVSGIAMRTICLLVATDKVHFKEIADGLLLICTKSLLKEI